MQSKSSPWLKRVFIALIATLPLGAGLANNSADRPAGESGELSIEPAELDFGTVEVGANEVLNVTVSNVAEPGADALTLDAIDVDGTEISDPATILASLGPDSNQLSDAFTAVMSADGRYIAFMAKVSVNPQIFRRDLLTGTTEMVSVDIEGHGVSGISETDIAISAAGRHVLYAHRLGSRPPIREGPKGFYIRDMDTGVNEFIDIPTTDGELPDSIPNNIAISADARIVAFMSSATNLLPGSCAENLELNCDDVYVYDRDADTLERVSTAFDGTPADSQSWMPAITPDGRHVAFSSWASNLVPDDTNGPGPDDPEWPNEDGSDVFVHDRATGVTERASVASDGGEGNGPSSILYPPAISADGRYVAFSSCASNLVPYDTNDNCALGEPGWDIFVRDRVAGVTELVSLAFDGAQGNHSSGPHVAITPDGRFVAFQSNASNLVPGDFNGADDHFVHDRLTGVTERISVRTDGTENDSIEFSARPAFSVDGRFVAFTTTKALVPEDTDIDPAKMVDVYVRDRGGAALATAFEITGGDCEVDTVLEPGDSCAVEITFTPDSAGAFEDMLNVATTDAQSASVPLHGNGAQGPVLAFSPPNLDFDTVEVGANEVLNVTVSNAADPGAGALTLDALGLDGGMLDPSTSLVSLLPDGSQFSGHGARRAVITPDGRYVAFTAQEANRPPVAYRRDLLTETTEMVSQDSEGRRVNASEFEGDIAISPDGRYVLYVHIGGTRPPIPGGPKGIYIRDMDAGINELIDIPTTDGELPDRLYPRAIAINADARIVAFTSTATNLLPGGCFEDLGPDEDCPDVYVYDRDTKTLERVSTAFDGTPPDSLSFLPAITSDGRYVAFISWATNLVPDDTNGPGANGADVFVHDRDTGVTERVSVAADGSEGSDQSSSQEFPAISADGRYVAFSSFATNLVPDDTNGNSDVFIRDRVAGTTDRMSVAPDGSQGNGPSLSPAITPDGRYVVFFSQAANLMPDDTNGVADHFIHDRATGITERVSVATDGTEGNTHSFNNRPGISADGRFVTFATNAALVPEDTNSDGSCGDPPATCPDIYVRDRGGAALATAFEITGGDCTPGTVLEPGDSCTVEVTFSPPQPGDFEGMLNVATGDEQSASVMLHGTAPQGPVLAFSPSSLDFGDVPVGTSSPPQNATLTNTGDGDVTDLSFTQSGSGFDANTSDCGNTLPVGDSCQVVVTFTPPETGSTFAPMDAESDEGATARLTLIGNGEDDGGGNGGEIIFDDRFEENP